MVRTTWLQLCVLMILLVGQCSGKQILFEDFDDWDAVGWNLYGTSSRAAESGDLRLQGADNYTGAIFGEVVDGDVSIRTQLRVVEGRAGIEIKSQLPGPDAYYFAITPEGSLELAATVDGVYNMYDGGQIDPLVSLEQDTIVQIDSVGGTVNARIWPADGAAPTSPQWSVEFEGHPLLDGGRAGLWVGVSDSETFSDVIFRYVRIEDSPIPIPEPCTFFLGALGFLGLVHCRWLAVGFSM